MTVKQLKDKLEELCEAGHSEKEVIILGCYASTGSIEKVEVDKYCPTETKYVALFSDICSG